MIELYSNMDSSSKLVVILTTAFMLTGIIGFTWFLVSKSKKK